MPKENAQQSNDDALFEQAAALLAGESEKSTEFKSVDDDGDDASSADDVSAVAVAPEPVSNQSSDVDLSALPESVQKKLNDLEQYKRSNEGRVSALQRKLDAQGAELSQLQQAGNGGSQRAQELQDQIERDSVSIEKMVEDFPEFAPLVSIIKKQQDQLNQFNSVVHDQVLSPAKQQAHQYEQQALAQQHQDFSEIEGNPAFWKWVDSQPLAVQKMAESDSASDVSFVLDTFKKSPSYQQKPAVTINRSLDDMATLPRGGNARGSQSGGGDDDALFAHYAGLADKGKL